MNLIKEICLIFIMGLLSSSNVYSAEYDALGRLKYFEGKEEVSCPVQTKDTAVILVIGQSLSANHHVQNFTTKYKQNVLNFYNGRCYTAASPLLGATSEYGEFTTLMGDMLLESKKYKNVILIPSGIGGSPISRWHKGSDLNDMVIGVIEGLSRTYKITAIIWQQGESDYLSLTSTASYMNSFSSLAKSLLEKAPKAPIFISISSKCGPNWIENNPIALAQNLLIDNKQIFLGVNSDKLLNANDRTPDECHLTESGQVKLSQAYANAIANHQK
jgi:hypothetical protein